MYNQKENLTELVRRLEEKNHIFSADPLLITEKLQNEPTPNPIKLQHRASRIDSDGKLVERLATFYTRIQGVILSGTVLWFMLGFVALFGAMQANVINFFYLLATLLSIHSLTLLIWLGFLCFSPKNKPTFFSTLLNPISIFPKKDTISQTIAELYQEQLKQIGTKWFFSRISHQFWLASLLGMLSALILLLLVKNYQFVWESTLLHNDTVIQLIEIMAFLPNFVGFPTPNADDILLSQTVSDVPKIVAFRWAMFLIGSFLLYGILPRFLVWLFCLLMIKSHRPTLDLKQPYYQKILDFWQRKVIDPDDSPSEQKPTAPVATISHQRKLAVLLEYPYANATWWQQALHGNADNFGILDEREDLQRLTAILQQQDYQVVVGIPPQCLPDRGTMRKLDKIIQSASAGLIVTLLEPVQDFLPTAEALHQQKTRLQQWETALAERKIAVLR